MRLNHLSQMKEKRALTEYSNPIRRHDSFTTFESGLPLDNYHVPFENGNRNSKKTSK